MITVVLPSFLFALQDWCLNLLLVVVRVPCLSYILPFPSVCVPSFPLFSCHLAVPSLGRRSVTYPCLVPRASRSLGRAPMPPFRGALLTNGKQRQSTAPY